MTHFMQFVRRTLKDIDQLVETFAVDYLCMSFSYRFHGNGCTLLRVDLYYLKDIDII